MSHNLFVFTELVDSLQGIEESLEESDTDASDSK